MEHNSRETWKGQNLVQAVKTDHQITIPTFKKENMQTDTYKCYSIIIVVNYKFGTETTANKIGEIKLLIK